MALPDLSTSGIGWIGFWNFLDEGGDGIDPFEVKSTMDTFSEFSNGVDGIVSYSRTNVSTLDIHCRAKADGWLIAWLPTNVANPVMDIYQDWSDGQTSYNDAGMLAYAISQMHSELSNSGQATFNRSDVSVYNYQYPDATTVSMAHNKGKYNNNTSTMHSYSYITPDSGIEFYATAAACGGGSDGVQYGGTWIDSNSEPKDVYSLGVLSPGVETEVDCQTGYEQHTKASHVLVWA